MAQLPEDEKDIIWQQIMAELSSRNIEIPVGKSDVRTLVNFMDEELEGAETGVINKIPGSNPGRAWLIANPSIGREMLEFTEKKRREVL